MIAWHKHNLGKALSAATQHTFEQHQVFRDISCEQQHICLVFVTIYTLYPFKILRVVNVDIRDRVNPHLAPFSTLGVSIDVVLIIRCSLNTSKRIWRHAANAARKPRNDVYQRRGEALATLVAQ